MGHIEWGVAFPFLVRRLRAVRLSLAQRTLLARLLARRTYWSLISPYNDSSCSLHELIASGGSLAVVVRPELLLHDRAGAAAGIWHRAVWLHPAEVDRELVLIDAAVAIAVELLDQNLD